jgi:hypothetical protein
MAVRSMETAETAMETDGDGSRGTSPSRQGAKTETSVPQNSSSVAAELRNSFGNFADSPRVFYPEASYRRRGVVRSGPGAPHHRWAWPGPGSCPLMVWLASGPSLAPVWSLYSVREKIGVSKLVSSNSENISCVAFLKHKNSRK